MDNENARLKLIEHARSIPEKIEQQFSELYVNPHFGNVVTEVFPEMLDSHNAYGRELLKKYSDVATFLEETKEFEEATFIALRLETEAIEFDAPHPHHAIQALSLRYYKGLRAEHFEVAKDEDGSPLGIGIAHPSFTYTTGWREEAQKDTTPYAIVDTPSNSISWSRSPSEFQSPGTYVHGKHSSQVYNSLLAVDNYHRLSMQPVSGLYLDIRRDEAVAKASVEQSEK